MCKDRSIQSYTLFLLYTAISNFNKMLTNYVQNVINVLRIQLLQ